jgi:thiamine biosynthesis lipoprotein
MSARSWQQWSCGVRVVVGQDETVPDAVVEEAAATLRALMSEVDRAVSRFRADSELERVNDAAPRLVPVGSLTLTLVRVALDAARRTDGAVDPTIGRHLAAWGYDADIDVVRAGDARPGAPTDACVDTPADWRRVVVDPLLGLVGVPDGLRLDLGATAKAWTADEAARRVAARHHRPVLVEIGGDVAVAGSSRAPWRVLVAESAEGPGEVVGLTRGGLATSSTLARRWSTDRGEAHHVIDPRTGAPAAGGLRSATVWAPSCLLANTWSTAALVGGAAAPAWLEAAGVSARLVADDGTVRRTGGWPSEERAA